MSFNEAIITVQRRERESEPSSRVFLAERLDETSVDEFVIGEEHDTNEIRMDRSLLLRIEHFSEEERIRTSPFFASSMYADVLSHSFALLFSRMSALSIPSEESTSDDDQIRDLDVAAIWSDDIEQSFRVSERLFVR